MGRRYKCHAENCDKEYTSKPNLLRHFRMLHLMNDSASQIRQKFRETTKYSSKEIVLGMKDNDYTCIIPGCHKIYKYKSRLRTHMRKHKLPSLLDVDLALPDGELFLSEETSMTSSIEVDSNLPRLSPSRKSSASILPSFDFSGSSRSL